VEGNTVGELSEGRCHDVVAPGVRVVVVDGLADTEQISELTTREALAALISGMPPHAAVSVERVEDSSVFAMAASTRGGFRVWYEADRGRTGAQTVRADSLAAAKALHDWATQAKGWEYGFHWAHSMPVPDRIPIAHEPGYRTDLIGSWDDGLFFAGFCGTTYLHLFDHDGHHLRSHIGIAEEAVGADDVTACMSRLREIVDDLPGRRFGDIAVRLFCVEHAGRKWGLFDLSPGHIHPHVEMEPDSLGFNPPWNGLYDT
jgi:formate hydrogenlyase regulatory protein HycA